MTPLYDQGPLEASIPRVLLRLRQALLAVGVLVFVGLAGYVAGSMYVAGQDPIVREVPVYVRAPAASVAPMTEIETAATSTAPAVRAPRRVLLVGDSSLSLWDEELAADIATTGTFLGYPVSTVKPLSEEGKLPCYFERFRPVDVQPGDLVLVSFALTQWHRTEDDTCRNSVAGAGQFYPMAESFLRYVEARGGDVVALALPRGQGPIAFTGEPWYPGMSPDEITAWWVDRVPVVGEACRAVEVFGPDGFHVDPTGEAPLAACVAGLSL